MSDNISAVQVASIENPPLAEKNDASVVIGSSAVTAQSTRREVFVQPSALIENPEDFVLVDTRPSHIFEAGHASGAINMPVDQIRFDRSDRQSLARTMAFIRAQLNARKLMLGDQIVFVDSLDGSAALAVVLADLAGATNAVMLDGGITNWIRSRGQVATSTPASPDAISDSDSTQTFVAQTTNVDSQDSRNTPLFAGFEDLVDAANNGTATLIDARSQLEHEGIVGPPCCGSRGHILGSLHLEWTSLISPTGSFHPDDRIARMMDELAVAPSDQIIVYCHTNVRAAFATLVLRNAGFANVRAALGGWHEWSTRGNS